MSVTYSRASADNGFSLSCLERIAGSALPKCEPKGTGESLHLHFTKQQALTIADNHYRVPGVRPPLRNSANHLKVRCTHRRFIMSEDVLLYH